MGRGWSDQEVSESRGSGHPDQTRSARSDPERERKAMGKLCRMTFCFSVRVKLTTLSRNCVSFVDYRGREKTVLPPSVQCYLIQFSFAFVRSYLHVNDFDPLLESYSKCITTSARNKLCFVHTCSMCCTRCSNHASPHW